MSFFNILAFFLSRQSFTCFFKILIHPYNSHNNKNQLQQQYWQKQNSQANITCHWNFCNHVCIVTLGLNTFVLLRYDELFRKQMSQPRFVNKLFLKILNKAGVSNTRPELFVWPATPFIYWKILYSALFWILFVFLDILGENNF